MSIGTSPLSPGSPAPFETRRFSIAEYHRLAEVGILSQDDRVELIEGVISPKVVHSPLHDATVSIVEHLFRGLLLPAFFVRVQSSVTLLASEPEPDVAVVRGTPADYARRHPSGPDVAMAIEVADSSLIRDRAKAEIYAAAGISHYLIVNLRERLLELFTQPGEAGYASCLSLESGAVLELRDAFVSGASVPVDDLLLRPT